MAARQNNSMQASRRPRGGMYVYGNTVRKADMPLPRREQEVEEQVRKKKRSPQIQRNRRQALHMNPAYVAFLTIAAVAALGVCIWYLQVRAELTARMEHLTALQQELAEAREENTTRHNAVVDSVDLEKVRERALGELGMHYAGTDQKITYPNPSGDYVKQYEDIPKDGVLSQSGIEE